ncbi:hypothetical protein [Streptomyces sp. I6]|uniref:hypothetical protein n=1 Tax=Streptomyces sp. I6 TaxID=2483113 RepID=UPI001613238C
MPAGAVSTTGTGISASTAGAAAVRRRSTSVTGRGTSTGRRPGVCTATAVIGTATTSRAAAATSPMPGYPEYSDSRLPATGSQATPGEDAVPEPRRPVVTPATTARTADVRAAVP